MLKIAAALATLTIVLSACGIPSDPVPQEFTQELHDDLKREGDQTDTTDISSEPDAQIVKIYLLDTSDEDRQTLAVADRSLPAGYSELDLIQAVEEGATVEEQGAGLNSTIPQGESSLIIGVEPSGTLLIVDLDDRFWELQATDLRIAAAQIVFTAVESVGTDHVEFRRNGEPRAIPETDGSISDDPKSLSISDFPELDPTRQVIES